MRSPIVLAAAFLLLPAAALAGSQSEPEIADEEGDFPAGPVDIISAWVEMASEDSFSISLQLAELPEAPGFAPCAPTDDGCPGAGVELHYRVDFRAHDPAGNPTLEASDDFQGSYVAAGFAEGDAALDSFWAFYVGHAEVGATGPVIVDDQPVEGSINGTTITWIVPRWVAGIEIPNGTAAAGYSLRDMGAATSITPRVVAGVLLPADEAGPGLDFVFPAPPGPTRVALDAPRLARTFESAQTGEHIHTFSVDAGDVTVAYEGSATSGKATMTLKDAAGATLLDRALAPGPSGEKAISGADPGVWTLTVVYEDFIGSVDVDVQATPIPTPEPAPEPDPEPEREPEPEPKPDQPARDDAAAAPTDDAEQGALDSTDQQAPGAGLLLTIVALGGYALRRRF